jgi:hypothetical protein
VRAYMCAYAYTACLVRNTVYVYPYTCLSLCLFLCLPVSMLA